MAKTKRNNLYKAGVETLSSAMTLDPKPMTLEQRLIHLKKLINQGEMIADREEIFEFMDASIEQAEELQNDLAEADAKADELVLEVERLQDRYDDLKADYDKMEDETDFDLALGSIQYRAKDINDQHLMEDFAAAYEVMKPWELGELLKILS